VQTFYWHDYETTGADPVRDRPIQFAGVRTDMDFNIIGDPLMIYCQPAFDVLPQPEACAITGITPQFALENGVCEAEFIARIHAELSQPGTCGVGYNSLRFDDEVTRHTLYRNFYDAYAREWQHGNSRWDIIDMARLCHAVRPDGINWPTQDDGSPSFRLELLTAANGLAHEAAHDALSDVYATINLAKLIRQAQPKLFEFVFNLRHKQAVTAQLDIVSQKPVLHISRMYAAGRGCAAVVMPLALDPVNKNAVVVFDLSENPDVLLSLAADEIRERIFTPRDKLPEGVSRIALKTIRTNRCPVVAPLSVLDEAAQKRLGIDLDVCRAHFSRLKGNDALATKLRDVFLPQHRDVPTDPDLMLYSGGFFSDHDKRQMQRIRDSAPEQLATTGFVFEDKRLYDMLLRYKGRNFPDFLDEDEFEQWEQYREKRFYTGGSASLTLPQYGEKLAECAHKQPDKMPLWQALQEWGEMVMA
jgi:exodeoxyribonuclease-1